MNPWFITPKIDDFLRRAPRLRALRIGAVMLAMAFVLTLVGLYATPWQQSVRGQGRVIAYAPLERRQTLEAPMAGRVVEWAVAEGESVEQGQLIAVISDNDPLLVQRLGRTYDAARTRLQTAQEAVKVYGQQIAALQAAQTAALAAAHNRVEMAIDRHHAAEQARDAATAAVRTAEANLVRHRALAAEGLTSTRSLELAELASATAGTDLQRAEASLRAALTEVRALKSERERIEADTGADIEKARAGLQSARSDVAKYEGDVVQREVDVARQHTMRITAPRAGTILRLLAKQGGEFVSAGDPVAVLVPTTESRAVELWVDGNDIPMVAPGRHVRLQFEGWPAVQFVGWPSVAVGTFPGQVAFVDSADDGNGHFRVVVIPAQDDGATPWPQAQYLRQGVQVNGWVLLDQVRLGFELWRQWNGFPPAMSRSPEDRPPGKAKPSKEKTKDTTKIKDEESDP